MKSIEAAKAAFKEAENNYYKMAKLWAEIQDKALDRIAELEAEIKDLQQQQKETNPNASQEESEHYHDEIHSLEVKVKQIKAQLDA